MNAQSKTSFLRRLPRLALALAFLGTSSLMGLEGSAMAQGWPPPHHHHHRPDAQESQLIRAAEAVSISDAALIPDRGGIFVRGL